MNLKTIEPYLIYKVIAGSKAYGLDIPTSDTDIRGVYILENWKLLTGNTVQQVGDKKSDQVFYELNRFVDLLCGANPNILENLFVPERCILHLAYPFTIFHENRDMFLTKKIKYTFGGYAISQIKKAKGLNKKINNPIPKEKKTILDFCYAIYKSTGYMVPMKQWLKDNGFEQKYCGVSQMPNGPDLYKVFHDTYIPGNLRGIISSNGNDIRHSEIPKNAQPFCFMWFNRDGYSSYCKEYKEYWEWVEKRNPHRYNDNISHNQGYDGKNIMHCLRMLDMAIEVAQGKGMILERPDRDFLLSVRRGEQPYDELIKIIEEKKVIMDESFEKSNLPERLDRKKIDLLIREARAI